MRKVSTLVILVSFFLSTYSQITLNSGDMPVAVWSQKVIKDTLPLPSVNYGNKGANQVYDFSNLSPYKHDTTEYRTPTPTQLSNLGNAPDDAITQDGINFLFTKTNSSKMTLQGFEGYLYGTILDANYNPVPDIYHFPTQYGGNFAGNSTLTKTLPGSAVGQSGVYQVRTTITSNYTDTIDGWGKVITPIGAYKCLREKRKEVTTTLNEYMLFSFSGWSNVSNPTTRTTVRYSYLTKEAKGNLVNFEYDSVDDLLSVTYSQIPPTAPVADFSFMVGANGSVAFTDLSDFYPTSWSWNFGDGSALSTQQNPTHVFAANNTYNVCLIATNAGGSSVQVCKQVVVNTVAAAPVAAFTWVNPSGGLVNFTDQSTNSPTSWAWTFGDAGTSNQQSPSHVYAANNTYNVCLTATNGGGSNQHCANVVVTNISAANHAPVAADDTASVLQPDGLIRNVGTNDLDPDGDNFCITAVYGSSHFAVAATGNCTSVQYTPDSTFCGFDSCYYIICDNGTPSLCDTGKFVVNSVCNSALLPVAIIGNWNANTCNTITIYQHSQNYTDTPIWYFDNFLNGHLDTLQQDTAFFVFFSSGFHGSVCLTVSNQFGTSTACDTLIFICETINEISLSNIQLYPNPSSNNITIDMSRNQDEATRNYSAIEIYNAVGAKVKLVGKGNKVVNIPVADLPEGMYLATLVDAKGTRRTLGRFTVSR